MLPRLPSRLIKHRPRLGLAGALALTGLLVIPIVMMGLNGVSVVAHRKHDEPNGERLANTRPSECQLERDCSPEVAEMRGSPVLPPFLGALDQTLRELQQESEPDLRERRMAVLLNWILEGDVLAALKFIDRQPPNALMRELQIGLLRQWAESDPRAAADASLELLAATRQEAVNSVLPLWAKHAAEDALGWVNQMPESELKTAAQITLGYETARTNPVIALERAMALPASTESDQLLTHAAMQWAAMNPRDAANWASKIEENPLRERLLATIATAWGNSEPASAARLAIETIPAGRAQSDALVGIVQRWAQADPAAAAAWVAKFPQGTLRTAAMENVTSQWGRIDFAKTGVWLNTLKRDASWDAAVGVYASVVAPYDRDLARSWATAIQDVQLRISVTNQLNNH